VEVIEAKGWRWFRRAVGLLQAGVPLELHVAGWRARRFARAVQLGDAYKPGFFSAWLMLTLEGVLVTARGSYSIEPRPIDRHRIAFIFTPGIRQRGVDA